MELRYLSEPLTFDKTELEGKTIYTYNPETTGEDAQTLITVEGGGIEVRGLDAGDYILTETKTRDGYSLLESDIAVTITALRENDKLTGAAEITVSGGGAKTLTDEGKLVNKGGETGNGLEYGENEHTGDTTGTDGVSNVNIVIRNYRSILLPETGRQAEIVILLAGCVLLLGGIYLVGEDSHFYKR